MAYTFLFLVEKVFRANNIVYFKTSGSRASVDNESVVLEDSMEFFTNGDLVTEHSRRLHAHLGCFAGHNDGDDRWLINKLETKSLDDFKGRLIWLNAYPVPNLRRQTFLVVNILKLSVDINPDVGRRDLKFLVAD